MTDGREIDIFDFVPRIKDIAYSLSRLCRWNGHTATWFSVAEHSIRVSRILPFDLKLAGLIHDGAEYLTGDIPTPIKKLCPDLVLLEQTIQKRINQYFGIVYHPKVKKADELILQWELENYVMKRGVSWSYGRAYRTFLGEWYGLRSR